MRTAASMICKRAHIVVKNRVRVCNFRLQFTPIQWSALLLFLVFTADLDILTGRCLIRFVTIQNFVTIYDNKRFRKNIRLVLDAAPLIYKGKNVEKSYRDTEKRDTEKMLYVVCLIKSYRMLNCAKRLGNFEHRQE